jgi:hypothetical protein
LGATSNGEEVLIQAKPWGSADFETVRRTTTSNGFWQALVKPRRNTVYRAVWNNVPSVGKTVWVRPMVTLKPASRGRLAVRAYADVNLRGHRVVLQRLIRRHHVWRSFRSVKLTRFTYKRASYIAIGRFKPRLAHGSIVRAVMTRAQAAPAMYGPAPSRAVRL